ncbi:MAG: hypothetical protein Q9P14_07375 [candidate division KSB1 bacterium]|nr:hypothetical protein [candidate division KSB1 bacterium]
MAKQTFNREPDSKLTRLLVKQQNDVVNELGGLQIFGLWSAPVLFILMLWLPAPEGLSAAGWYTAAIGLLYGHLVDDRGAAHTGDILATACIVSRSWRGNHP